MITISIAVEDKALWAEVHSCLQEEPVQIDVEQPQVGDLGAFCASLERANPDLVLIDVSVLRDTLTDVIRKLRVAAPGSMIVALNTSAPTAAILDCFRAGADEYLFLPIADRLKKSIELRIAQRKLVESAQPGGKIVAFLSAKGGCGATTLACHVAAELGRMNQRVLLADLDMTSGMVAFLLKSKSQYSVTDALNNIHRLDPSYWRALVSNGLPNLEIIAAPSTLATKHDMRLGEIRQVLAFVRKQYQWTIADCGRSLNKSTMTEIESSDEACLVTTPEIPALQQTKEILQTLLDSGYKQESIKLILNRVPKRSGIRPDDIHTMLGIPLYAVFPESYLELHEAYAQGQLLSARTDVGKLIARFARKLAGVEAEDKVKSGFFG